MLTTTTLRNVHLVDIEDFGYSEEQYEKLKFAQYMQIPVTVDCEACDGYYDITLSDGTELPAVSSYHLVGFNDESM